MFVNGINRMKVQEIQLNDITSFNDGLSLCLGYFDGLHIGHKKLVDAAINGNYHPALLTLQIDDDINIKYKKKITTIEDKIEILNDWGIDYLLILKFDLIIKNLSPEEFVENIIIKLNAKEVIVGSDFKFGRNAEGNVETLRKLSNNRYKTICVSKVKLDNKKISSREIISAIEDGNVIKAKELLGRYYSITSKVSKGYHFGNTQNFPTANLQINDYVAPKNGVYATIVEVDYKFYLSITNVGIHPTINQLNKPIIETHIINFNQDIYDKKVRVFFLDFIRGEMKFPSIKELYKQLENDKEKCISKYGWMFDYESKIKPFVGVDKFLFGLELDVFKEIFNINDIALYGPTFECDEHYYLAEIDGLRLYFNKQTKKLFEIDVLDDRYGKFGKIFIGNSIKDLFEEYQISRVENTANLFYSKKGFLLVCEPNTLRIISIALFDLSEFKNLCITYEDRMERDKKLYRKMEVFLNRYMDSQSNSSKEKLINYFEMNLEITERFIMDHLYSILPIKQVFNTLLERNNYFNNYQSGEKELALEIADYLNKNAEH